MQIVSFALHSQHFARENYGQPVKIFKKVGVKVKIPPVKKIKRRANKGFHGHFWFSRKKKHCSRTLLFPYLCCRRQILIFLSKSLGGWGYPPKFWNFSASFFDNFGFLTAGSSRRPGAVLRSVRQLCWPPGAKRHRSNPKILKKTGVTPN